MVIKYGGAAMREESLRDAFATDVVLLKYVGLNPVVVHGGGPEITEYMERLGSRSSSTRACASPTPRRSRSRAWSWSASSTPTSSSGSTATASRRSASPGQDGSLFDVAPVANAEQVGFVGTIERVDVDVLNHIAADYIPVIASSASDREGQTYNVNADEAAGKVAAALGAHKAIFLTDVVGWLADPADEGSLISRATVAEVEAGLTSVDGGMRPKLQACLDAIRGGSQSAHIVDGRRPHSLLLELFTDAGIGTMVTP